jgi:LacI family transcriptional regulator
VSVTTVSHYLAGKPGACSTETAEKIEAAAKKLGYKPKPASLPPRSSAKVIGVAILSPFIDEASGDTPDVFRNSFLERVWRGIWGESEATDYRLMVFPNSVITGPSADPYLDGSIQGLIVMGSTQDEAPNQAALKGLPTVVVSRTQGLADQISAVYVDEKLVVEVAMNHLWSMGHRRIGHITGPVVTEVEPSGYRILPDEIALRRLVAYEEWMSQMGELDSQLIQKSNSWDSSYSHQAIRRWSEMPHPPTAILCANDGKALEVIKAAHSIGLRVPEDLSVVGIDNILGSRSCAPSLTTVDISGEEVGREAFRQALLRIASPTAPATHRRLEAARLIVRASSGPHSSRHSPVAYGRREPAREVPPTQS